MRYCIHPTTHINTHVFFVHFDIIRSFFYSHHYLLFELFSWSNLNKNYVFFSNFSKNLHLLLSSIVYIILSVCLSVCLLGNIFFSLNMCIHIERQTIKKVLCYLKEHGLKVCPMDVSLDRMDKDS